MTAQVTEVVRSRVNEEDRKGLWDFLRVCPVGLLSNLTEMDYVICCQTLIAPLVRKLGYEYSCDEHPDNIKLRTAAIETAVNADLSE